MTSINFNINGTILVVTVKGNCYIFQTNAFQNSCSMRKLVTHGWDCLFEHGLEYSDVNKVINHIHSWGHINDIRITVR